MYNVIYEITGHAHESSLDNYDEIDENQRKELLHINSGYKEVQNEKSLESTETETETKCFNRNIKRRPFSSVGRALREPEVVSSNPGRTNTQGLKITEEKVLSL